MTDEPISEPWDSTEKLLADFLGEFSYIRDNPCARPEVPELKRRLGYYNRAITADYQQMSVSLRTQLGIDDQLVDWAGFGAWVSCSVGAYLDQTADNSAYAAYPKCLRFAIKQILPRLIDAQDWVALARANLQIFTEMRAVYDTAISLMVAGVDSTSPEVDEATKVLFYGPEFNATDIKLTESDQCWIDQAIRAILEANATPDLEQRSQILYAASVAMSAAEQRRADTHIDQFLEGISERKRWVPACLRKLVTTFVVRFGTKNFTMFLTPKGLISVGKSLPRPEDDEYTNGCNSLSDICHPKARLVSNWFRGQKDCAADDWTRYGQRMNYIIEYFQYYQEVTTFLKFEGLPKPGNRPPIRSSMDNCMNRHSLT